MTPTQKRAYDRAQRNLAKLSKERRQAREQGKPWKTGSLKDQSYWMAKATLEALER